MEATAAVELSSSSSLGRFKSVTETSLVQSREGEEPRDDLLDFVDEMKLIFAPLVFSFQMRYSTTRGKQHPCFVSLN